jgi:hypothetical protein
MLNSLIPIIASSGGAGGAAGTFESIASATGDGTSGTITFSSIPATYASLQIRFIVKSSSAGSTTTGMSFYPNSETGSSTTFDRHYLYGDGTTAAGSNSISQGEFFAYKVLPRASSTADVFGVGIIDIHNYASTTQNKTVRMFFGYDNNSASTESQVYLESGLYRSTSAITSLRFTGGTAFITGTTIALYGIKGA